jgi:hypothetical protein
MTTIPVKERWGNNILLGEGVLPWMNMMRWRELRVGGGRRVFGGPQGGVGEGVGRFVGLCQLRAAVGRGKEELFFFAVSTQTAQVSLEQRALSEERSKRARGAPGEGLVCSGSTCALVAVAGRGGENFFFFYRFPCWQLRCRRSSALRVASSHRAPGVVLVRGWAALGGPARSWVLVAIAGRGGEEPSPPFVTRSRGFLLRGTRVAVLRWNN